MMEWIKAWGTWLDKARQAWIEDISSILPLALGRDLRALCCRARIDLTTDPQTLQLADGRVFALEDWRGHPERGGIVEADILIPGEGVLFQDVTLPVAAKANLKAALELRLPGSSPWRPEEIAFDFHAEPISKGAEQIQVKLAILPPPLRTQVATLAEEFGMRRCHIAIQHSAFRFTEQFAPLPPLWRRPGWQALGLALVTIGLLASALTVWANRLDGQAAAMEAEIAKARGQVLGLSQLRDEAEIAVAAQAFYRTRAEGPSAVSVLNAVTGALPDGAWISKFRVEGNAIEMTGTAANLAEVDRSLKAVFSGVSVIAEPEAGTPQGPISFMATAQAIPPGSTEGGEVAQ